MRAALLPLTALAALAVVAARSDHDFEFDDAPDIVQHRPRRYVYDPQNEMCRTLVCKKREVCLLRDSYTALCASKKDILQRGDVIVASAPSAAPASDDDDVFYETRAAAPAAPQVGNRCVGCSSATRGGFLCGSDNRTYSSLCRLDLHNCVHRAHPPVRLACAGFCPCRERSLHRPRAARRRFGGISNEVLPPRPAPSCALDKMADRLLDWFSVLMEQARGSPPPASAFPAGCKPEVRWMFEHLDSAGDGLLTPNDLYALSHDERERCLRPFLARCGAGGGVGVSRDAWCACLRRATRPCTAWARAARTAGGSRTRVGFVPACDARGFYRPRQCHAALAVCWCVDAHGQELPGTRTKGAPSCPGESVETDEGREVVQALDGVEGAPADDEDAGGSGDRELDSRY